MGNCLKTQLKESVNNDNLLFMGELPLNVMQDQAVLGIMVSDINDPVVIKCENCNIGGSTEVSVVADYIKEHTITVTGENPKVHLLNKYNIKRIRTSYIKLDCSKASSLNSLTHIVIYGDVIGDISYISSIVGDSNYETPGSFILEGESYTGDLTSFGLNKKYIGNVYISGSNIKGNLNNLGYSGKSLTQVQVTPTICSVSLDLIEFVHNARTNGASERSTNLQIIGTNRMHTTAGDTEITDSVVNLSWTASTITYNDTTINA